MGRLISVSVVSILLFTPVCLARTWSVPSAECPTIQAGIDSASVGDTVLVASGTYTGEDNKNLDFGGTDLVLLSEAGPEMTIIDCEGSGRGFYFHSGETAAAVVEGFTITNAYSYDHGGGMYCFPSDPTVSNCTFTGNAAHGSGGGMFCFRSNPTASNCTFTGNTAVGSGGGIFCYTSNSTVSNCTFTGNTASSCAGGMYCSDCSTTVSNCTFVGNLSGYEGGGMHCEGSSLAVMNCTFSLNETRYGGGMHCYDSNPEISYCTFSGNTASQCGGGMDCSYDSSPTLSYCTFSGNAGSCNGGGIHCRDYSHPELENTIIAFSPQGEAVWCLSGAGATLTCCDVYGNAGGDWVGPIADQYGVNGNISVDPVFCGPDVYDFHLSLDSPCLCAGMCDTIGAYGPGCDLIFGIWCITDHPEDHGGAVDITWRRIGYDSAGSDTVVDYYSVWRRADGSPVKAGSSPGEYLPARLGDPPGTWERMDSIPASEQFNYSLTCSTTCDSTEVGGPCWSVFYIKAHCSDPVLEFDTEPDSGYSFDDIGGTVVEAWTDVTTSTLANVAWGHGFAWMDYDNDGDLDIFVTNRHTEDKLFRNDSLSAGGFVDATPAILADSGDCKGAAWGDYDNDGDLDLYVSKTGRNRLYRNNGSGSFSDVTASPIDDYGVGQTASWADYDSDGDLDLYLVNNGSNRLFRNDGAGVFTDVTSGPLGNHSSGKGSGWADYDNDGDLDIYIANSSGANVLLENQGGDVFTDATTPVLGITDPSFGVAWGDYDNDGDLDLFVANDGPNSMLRNDGGGFVDVSAPPLEFSKDSRSAAWGDYDLDGDLDLYLVDHGGSNRLFKNKGGGTFVEPECAASCIADNGKGFSTGWGDYDRDGDLDIYLVNDGRNGLFRNDLYSERHWLEIRLAGVISNRYGQGARVKVVAGRVSQMREIAGASGYLSQGPLTAFFGLGTECVVDTVEVTWPASGIVQVMTGVTCDQTLEVVEDLLANVSDKGKAPLALRLYANRPNPFTTETLIGYDLPERSQVGLAIYDVSGRSVCTLVDGESRDPGRYTVHWDGRNSAGKPAAPGIYFCRLTAGPHTRTQSLVLLK